MRGTVAAGLLDERSSYHLALSEIISFAVPRFEKASCIYFKLLPFIFEIEPSVMMTHDSEPLFSDIACNLNSADMSPIVSIIVTCFNQAHFLSITLARIQSQTLKEWGGLIIDDGSPDDTESVAKSWVAKRENGLHETINIVLKKFRA
jgi:Glycosyl transferase family 2